MQLNTKLITLNKGLFAIVDEEDYDIMMSVNKTWRAWLQGYTHYALAYDSYSYVMMHRLIAKAPRGIEVDHIDRNGLNNCKSNLRLTDKAGNANNRKLYSNNTSGMAGVNFEYRYNKPWQARFERNGVMLLRKRFYEKEDAIAAVRQAQEDYNQQHIDMAPAPNTPTIPYPP